MLVHKGGQINNVQLITGLRIAEMSQLQNCSVKCTKNGSYCENVKKGRKSQGGGGGGGGGGGCVQRMEVIVKRKKKSKKKFFFWGGGGGGGWWVGVWGRSGGGVRSGVGVGEVRGSKVWASW